MPISGTIAERYLRGRGITCALPSTLRYHPSCWHASAKRFPALVARVEGSDGAAIHRTYLAPDGRGKAAVTPDKAMLGAVAGGAVRLTQGPGALLIGEGIESTLSAFILHGDPTANAWAALSTSGLRGLRLPSVGNAGTVGTSRPSLVIAVDGEKAGRDAGRDLAERAAGLGWQVGIMDPGDGADWNDRLMMEARHECA
ncbi:MAG: toprim domain-containing protein [Roseovarius sp.]|nr:toprim domain-containing protein [Roseovarius sp.]